MAYFAHYILSILVFMSSCSFNGHYNAQDRPIRVTDFRDTEIALEKPAERVVCLIESALSGIYMLQAQERVIGIPSSVYAVPLHRYYTQLDPRIKSRQLPAVGNWDYISLENIVGLNPDLVIIWASQVEAIESIEQFGIPVYAVMLHSIEDVYKEIADLGVLLDRIPRAETLIQQTADSLDVLRMNQIGSDPQSVYFMWAQGITETSGLNSTVNELMQAAGVMNACTMEPEHLTVSIEKLYDWNPDMIVMWYNEKLDPRDIIDNPLLQGLRAVQTGRVYELPDPFTCDFWTLKFPYPVKLLNSWAYAKSPEGRKAIHTEPGPMFSALYKQSLY
jgi:iron complex transport system substrate-binding protein